MPQFSIERNGQHHGPYDLNALKTYLYEGKILAQDKTIGPNGEISTVREVLKKNGLSTSVKNNGNILKQIKSFGASLLFPKKSFSFATFKNDQKLLLVSIIGLAPAFLIRFTDASIFTFYAIALYFSVLWGLFFYSVFNTSQVTVKKSITIFFLVQAIIFISIDVLRLTEYNPFYSLTEDHQPFFSRLIGFIFGVGAFEETIKFLPVFLITRLSKEPLKPQTVVFYGLISGIGFGVFEGVQYQILVNSKLDYNTSFFLNIARLTSLPFLHAIWSGISSYFLAFAFLYPTNRIALWIIAIAIPAILHGLYDTFTWSIPGLFVSYIGVALLMIYLKNAKDFQKKIVQ
jgi:protease PrsW